MRTTRRLLNSVFPQPGDQPVRHPLLLFGTLGGAVLLWSCARPPVAPPVLVPVPANYRVPLSETPPVLTPFPAKGPAPNDSVLFRLTVAAMLAESDRTRVDARPLKPDPSLVTLIVMDVFPEKISAEASRKPWADVNTPVLAARLRVLRELGAPATDALEDMNCKGPSIFPMMLGGQKATPHPACPPEGGDYYSKIGRAHV